MKSVNILPKWIYLEVQGGQHPTCPDEPSGAG